MKVRAAGTAKRRVHFWLDARFLIGLVLVAVSVAAVVAIVSTADTTIQVYAARQPLAQGDLITDDDVVQASVRIAGAADLYLLDGEMPSEGLVVSKPVAAGELIPASAVGNAASQRFSAVVITLAGRLPASVAPGSLVDLWASHEEDSGDFGPPSVVVSSATVVRLVDEDGLVVDDTAAIVELLVPRSRIARVLEAVANDDALSLIPVTLPARG